MPTSSQNSLDTQTRSSGASRANRRLSRAIGFPVAAVLLGLSPFLVAEAVLEIFDVARPTGYVDPFVGFRRIQPLFEEDHEGKFYRTVQSRTRYFFPQKFLGEKPSGGMRIFGLGGSTVQGRPYQPATAFLKWLEIELTHGDSGRSCETVNCGGLSYASYRLAPILQEVLTYKPDLIVIATGHNEFLEDRTYRSIKERSSARAWVEERTFALRTVTLARRTLGAISPRGEQVPNSSLLPEDVEAKLDSQSGYASYHRDEQWRKQVIRHFDQTLRAMVAMCREAGVPCVLVNLGMNLRDCPPFKSEHRDGLSVENLNGWEREFDLGAQGEDDDLEGALSHYRNAESIDGDYALLSFRIARCLDRLGRFEEARRYYLQAKEQDVCPLRALEEIRVELTQIASETGTPIVDARALIELHSPHQIPGYDWYVDHVHPTIQGHQIIAHALANTIRTMNQGRRVDSWTVQQRRNAYRRHLQQLDAAYFANGRRRVGWVEHWARWERLADEIIPKDTDSFLRAGQRHLDLDETNAAWECFARACSASSSAPARILDQALQLFRQGRLEMARELVRRLDEDPASQSLGPELELASIVLSLEAGETAEAALIYQEHADALHALSSASTGWLTAMPDALRRAAQPAEGP